MMLVKVVSPDPAPLRDQKLAPDLKRKVDEVRAAKARGASVKEQLAVGVCWPFLYWS